MAYKIFFNAAYPFIQRTGKKAKSVKTRYKWIDKKGEKYTSLIQKKHSNKRHHPMYKLKSES